LALNDFGVVGTFQSLEGKEVKLAIRGGELVDSVAPWVKVGDAFAVVRMSRQGGKLRANLIEAAVLQVVDAPKDGHVRCRYFCRYLEDWSLKDDPAADAQGDSPALGYRCLKLSTIRGPLKLRLVDEKTQEFLNFSVDVSETPNFATAEARGATVQGLFETKAVFAKVAYVQIKSGGTPLVTLPVPLVDDRTIVCRMSRDENAIKQGEVILRLNRWVRWSYEALSTSDQQQSEYNAALSGPLDQAIKLGQQQLDATKTEIGRLTSERGELVKLAAGHKVGIDLREGDQLIGELSRRQTLLQKSLVKVDKLQKDEESDAKKEQLAALERAEWFAAQADFDQAIRLYEKVLKERPDSVTVKTQLDQLKAAWAIKDKDHEQARQFIYDTWPSLDLHGLKTNIAKAKEMLARCQTAGDTKTPLKLVLANVNHATVLAKRLEVLRKAPVDTEDNRTEIKSLVQLADDLRDLQQKALAWVTGKDKKTEK
jgi:tetratricopeptide (TPR) repeat protein